MGLVCTAETGLDPVILGQLGNPSVYDENNGVNNKNLDNFLYCTFNKLGFGKKNGHVKINRILELFPSVVDKEALRQLMQECNELDGRNPADTTYKIFGCFIKSSPVHITV